MEPEDFQKELDDRDAAQQSKDDKTAQLKAINKAGIKNVEATNAGTKATVESARAIKEGVKITNPDLAKSGDVAGVVDSINKLNLTTFMSNEGLPKLAQNLTDLSDKTQALQDKLESEGLNKVSAELGQLVKKLDDVSKTLAKAEVSVDSKLQKTLDNLGKSIDKIDFQPKVDFVAPETKIVTTPVDLKPILKGLQAVQEAITAKETPDNEVDLSEVISGLSSVQDAITSLRFPVPNYVLPYKDVNGKDTQVTLQADGSLPITASISTGGLATSANQTNGTQLTQIVDAGGDAVTVTGGKLDVNATASLAGSSIPISGASTGVGVAILDGSGNQINSFGGGTQYTDGGTPPTHAIGTVPVYDNAGTWKSVSATNKLPVNTGLTQPTTPSDTQPVSAVSLPLPSGAATATKQDTGNTSLSSIDGKITAVNTGAVVVASSALPTGAATAAKQPALGTAGTSSADVLTVQGRASMTPLLTDGSATIQPISGTVTANAGTNLNTSALATSTNITGGGQKSQIVDGSGNVIGATSNALDVNIKSGASSGTQYADGAARGTATGTLAMGDDGTNIQSLRADSSGVLAIQDNGGSLTVDNGGTFAVQATLSAETTKVIGTVNQGTSPWVTSNATTSVVGNGSAATAQRVTLANDSTGVIATVSAVTAITNALPAGTNLLGKVGIDQTTPGTTNLVALAANQSVNVAQINGVTPLMGNGTTGTGSQRVTIASDNTAFAVNATLSAETTKVIGTVNQGTSPWVVSGNLTNISGTISLPTGAATSANQTTEIASLVTIAALSKAEDAAHTTGDTGVMALGVRNDTVADTTNTNADYTQLSTDVKGHLLTADAPRALKGRQVTTITSSTAETTIVTAVTSTFLDIYRIVVTNTSATACTVTIKDSTAGTTVWVWNIPAGDSRGMSGPMDAAANQSTINNNWTATCGTSVASIVVTAEYVKNI